MLNRPTESERTECAIKAKLRSIMMFRDLENVTSKEVSHQALWGTQIGLLWQLTLHGRRTIVQPNTGSVLPLSDPCGARAAYEL